MTSKYGDQSYIFTKILSLVEDKNEIIKNVVCINLSLLHKIKKNYCSRKLENIKINRREETGKLVASHLGPSPSLIFSSIPPTKIFNIFFSQSNILPYDFLFEQNLCTVLKCYSFVHLLRFCHMNFFS